MSAKGQTHATQQRQYAMMNMEAIVVYAKLDTRKKQWA